MLSQLGYFLGWNRGDFFYIEIYLVKGNVDPNTNEVLIDPGVLSY